MIAVYGHVYAIYAFQISNETELVLFILNANIEYV